MGAQTLLIENALRVPHIAQEISELDKNLGPGGSAKALKLSFFRDRARLPRVQRLANRSFVGQATLINYQPPGDSDWVSYIFEAIMSVPRRALDKLELLNHFYHTRRIFSVVVQGREFKIPAVYYCQQNGHTHVCAHAALRMALNTVAPSKKLISNRDIQEALGVAPVDVSVQNIARVLAKRQLEPFVWNFDAPPPSVAVNGPRRRTRTPVDWLRLVYSIVESGYPALLVFSTSDNTADHVIPVWGHTLNVDEWHPQAQRLYAGPRSARYYPSSAWADHFLIHDDNLGPYYCMARDALSTHRKVGPRSVIGLFPRRIGYSPILVENLANAVLARFLPSLRRYGRGEWWSYIIKRSPIYVLRTLLIEREKYLEHLREARGHDRSRVNSGELSRLGAVLPEVFWMTEFTLPDLYVGNKSKLGEVLVNSTLDDAQPLILAVRMPSLTFISDDPRAGTVHSSSCYSHIPLARISQNWNEW